MARPKKFRVPEEDIQEAGLKADYFADQRSSSGYIKIRLNSTGASMMARSTEREIEERQKELEQLKARHRALEKEEVKSEKRSKKEKKKDKKKKKKEKKKMKDLPEASRILFGAIEDYKEKFHKSKKDKKNERKDFEGVSSKTKGGTAAPKNEEEEERKRKEREAREFDKKFEEPITLLRQTVLEVDKTIQEIDKLIIETKESRARNRGVMLKDLFMAKNGLLSNRTANARGIGDLQKTKVDIEQKRKKEIAENQNDKNQNVALLAKVFPHLVANTSSRLAPEKDEKEKKDKDKDKRKKNRSESDRRFSERATDLIREGKIEFTPHEASIDMEGKYKVAVKKSFKNHDWEFIAIDNNGKELRKFKEQYPGVLPKKKFHQLRFDDQNDVAKCSRTDQVFQVIPVPYL